MKPRERVTEVGGHKLWCLKNTGVTPNDAYHNHYVAMFEVMDVNPTGMVRLKCTWTTKQAMVSHGYHVGHEHYSEKYDHMVTNKPILGAQPQWYPVTDTDYVLIMMED